MIVELIITALVALVSFIGSLFPTISLPGWFTSLVGHVEFVAGYMSGLGQWIPFGPAGNALAFVLVAVGVAVIVKLVRIVASFITAGGGSAA